MLMVDATVGIMVAPEGYDKVNIYLWKDPQKEAQAYVDNLIAQGYTFVIITSLCKPGTKTFTVVRGRDLDGLAKISI